MKRTHAKLRALIKADAKNNVGGLGAILEMIVAPSFGEAPNVLANSSFNKAHGQFLFGGDFGECDVSDLFESVLRKLPEDSVDSLRKLFMLAYFEGAVGAGRELSESLQRYQQTESGRHGGKIRGAKKAQEAKERWQDAALPIAQEFQRQNPDAGQDLIAKEIRRKLTDDAPEVAQIKKVVGGWQNDGLLKKVRPSPKRNREVKGLHTPSK